MKSGQKVLVATKETQGQRASDFSFVPDGELVRFGLACDNTNCDIDGDCPCRRSLLGFDSHSSTTTFKVIVVKGGTDEMFNNAYAISEAAAGGRIDKDTTKAANKILKIAAKYPEGTILEYRNGKFGVRKK